MLNTKPLKHSAKSSKILLKLFVVALMIIQTIIVAVGKSYYQRFLDLESEDKRFEREIETLTYELRLARDKISSLEMELHTVNVHLLEDAHGEKSYKPGSLQTKRD